MNLLTFVQIPLKAWNNRALLLNLWRFGAGGHEERLEALADFRKWHAKKAADEQRLEGREAAKQLASELIERPEIFAELDKTPHLGVLSPLVETAYTRLDYVTRQCALALDLKRSYPGLGLGSRGGQDATIRYGGRGLSGLAMMQTWAVLGSWGHLFGTFATERALLFLLRRDRKLQGQFLDALHEPFRSHAERFIQEGRVYQLVHALVAWRLCTNLDGLPEPMRQAALECQRMYLEAENSDRSVRLKELFRRMREVAYLGLHDEGLGGLRPVAQPDYKNRILLDDGIRFEPFAPGYTELEGVMSAVDRYHYDAFFTSEQAGRLVLEHLSQFKLWWEQTAASESFEDKLGRLFRKPKDWPEVARPELATCQLRFRKPFSYKDDWIRDLEAWWDGRTPWGSSSDFFYNFPPTSDSATINLYSMTSLPPGSVFHVAGRLADESDALWTSQSKRGVSIPVRHQFWRSVAQFGCYLLGQNIKEPESVRFDLVPVRCEDAKRVGYATLASSLGELRDRAREVVRSFSDEQRQGELDRVLERIEALPVESGRVHLLLLGTLLLVPVGGGEDRGEIDGVLASIGPDSVTWRLLEVKESKSSGSQGQLDKIAQALGLSERPSSLESPLRGAELEFRWPEGGEVVDGS